MKDFIINHIDNISLIIIVVMCIVGAILMLLAVGVVVAVLTGEFIRFFKKKVIVKPVVNTVTIRCPDCQRKFDEQWQGEELQYTSAIKAVIDNGQASTSFLQEVFRIGYTKAVHLIERMERDGIISHKNGSRPRDVLIGSLDELNDRKK